MFEDSSKFDVKKLLKAIIVSLISTIILFLIFALVLYTTNISESVISKVVFIISIISLMFGGIIASRNAEKSGFLHGAIVAGVYFLIVFIGAMIVNKGVVFNMKMITALIGYMAAGMFGGSIGINMKSKKKYQRR